MTSFSNNEITEKQKIKQKSNYDSSSSKLIKSKKRVKKFRSLEKKVREME